MEEEKAQQLSRFLSMGHVAWVIYDDVRSSDSDGTILDLSHLLKVELVAESVQSFDTRWDDTIIAMSKTPDDEVLENYLLQQRNSRRSSEGRAKELFKVRQETVRRYLEQKTREKPFPSRDRIE